MCNKSFYSENLKLKVTRRHLRWFFKFTWYLDDTKQDKDTLLISNTTDFAPWPA